MKNIGKINSISIPEVNNQESGCKERLARFAGSIVRSLDVKTYLHHYLQHAYSKLTGQDYEIWLPSQHAWVVEDKTTLIIEEKFLSKRKNGANTSCLQTADRLNYVLTGVSRNHNTSFENNEVRYLYDNVMQSLFREIISCRGNYIFHIELCEFKTLKGLCIPYHAFLIEKQCSIYRVHQAFQNRYTYEDWFLGKIDCLSKSTTLFFNEPHLLNNFLHKLKSLMIAIDNRSDISKINEISTELFGAPLISSDNVKYFHEVAKEYKGSLLRVFKAKVDADSS